MAKSLYIATTEAQSGKSLVSLGLVDIALRKTNKVGVFRPIIHHEGLNSERDDHLELLVSRVGDGLAFEDCFGFTRMEANELLAQGELDTLIDGIIAKYKPLEDHFDYIVIEGTDFTGEGAAFEFDLNAEIARNLASPVLLVENASGEDQSEVLRNLQYSIDSFIKNECTVLGAVINRVPEARRAHILEEFRGGLPKGFLLFAIPENKVLGSPTLAEIQHQLGADILHGDSKLDNLAYDYQVAAMHIPHFLDYLDQKQVVITPGDRNDLIISTLLAHASKNYPSVSGIVLTGGLKPGESVMRLLEGFSHDVPILTVKTNTFQTAQLIGNVQSKLSIHNEKKIRIGLEIFRQYVDSDAISERMLAFQPRGMTPGMFIYQLNQKAKSDKRHIVLPEGTDKRILRAAEHLLQHELVKLTLIGDPEEVETMISSMGLEFPRADFQVISPDTFPKFDDYVQTFYELRKHKGLTPEQARDVMQDVSYLGTMMVYRGDADGMVSGAQHTTQHTIRPALQFIKTQPGLKVVSSVFFMCLEDRVLVYGDCAVNPNPDAEALAEIALASADTSQAFGIQPVVAMLSYSSGTSGKGEEVEKVREATRMVAEKRPELLLEGPLQYDAAVDLGVAAKKMPDSKVAGRATVLIFPDLNTGNNTYKAVQRETGAVAIGPVLQGLRKPVNDLSRGATVEDVINTVVITAIQAQQIAVPA